MTKTKTPAKATRAGARAPNKTRAPRAKTTAAAPPIESAGLKPVGGKLGEMLALLRRPEGATVQAMMSATGWQAHSVRGAMSGALKKRRGLAVTSEAADGGRVYRVTEGVGA